MGKYKYNSSDLIVTVIAVNPIIQESVVEGRLSEEYLKARICSQCPKDLLKYAGVVPHLIHGDSEALEQGMYELLSRGILMRQCKGDSLRWVFPDSPKEYYEREVRKHLQRNKRTRLEEFARNF